MCRCEVDEQKLLDISIMVYFVLVEDVVVVYLRSGNRNIFVRAIGGGGGGVIVIIFSGWCKKICLGVMSVTGLPLSLYGIIPVGFCGDFANDISDKNVAHEDGCV